MLTWFGIISYLYFFENSLAIEMLIANETIAILSESKITSENKDKGGNSGAGMPRCKFPTILMFQFSLNLNKYEKSVPKTTIINSIGTGIIILVLNFSFISSLTRANTTIEITDTITAAPFVLVIFLNISIQAYEEISI